MSHTNNFVTIQIRPATLADATTLTQLGKRTFYETFAANNTPDNMTAYLTETFTVDKQTAELSDAATRVLLAEHGDKAVGYAQLRIGAMEAGVSGVRPLELARLYVLRDYIGHGVGAALMQACLDMARTHQYDVLWLGVWKQNLRAIQFYESWGFRTVGSHIFMLGQDEQTDLIMQRQVQQDLQDADYVELLRRVLQTAVTRLRAIPEKQAAHRPQPNAWSAKEILGHLIDSAVHNHGRFVNAQTKDDLVFPGYNQEQWVQIQQYQQEPWDALITLWHAYNQHLLHVVTLIPADLLNKPRHPHSLDHIALHPVPADQPTTLHTLIQDYILHLQAHLQQIFTLTE
jgi:ribosomal protein S18 acetylase RimI-like enzyme